MVNILSCKASKGPGYFKREVISCYSWASGEIALPYGKCSEMWLGCNHENNVCKLAHLALLSCVNGKSPSSFHGFPREFHCLKREFVSSILFERKKKTG